MKTLLQYLGLFIILLGFLILIIVGFQGITGNSMLLLSGGFIVVGLFGYIFLNKHSS